MSLPPFPVDDITLDLLMAAIDPRGHGDETAQRSSVGEFLSWMSELGGSDPSAVMHVVNVGARVAVMRDPHYHADDVITALVQEVRRLRALGVSPAAGGVT